MTGSEEPITIPSEQDLVAWLDGAWARRGRRIGRGAFDEPTSVLWLTVSPYFCDLRVLERAERHPNTLDETQAFTGTVSVAENVVTWAHDLDTTDRLADHCDTAPVIGHHNELLEIGEDYEERWVRSMPIGAISGVAETFGTSGGLRARVIVVGSAAIAVWSCPSAGGALLEGSDGWAAAHTIGTTPDDLALSSVADSIATANVIPTGWIRVA